MANEPREPQLPDSYNNPAELEPAALEDDPDPDAVNAAELGIEEKAAWKVWFASSGHKPGRGERKKMVRACYAMVEKPELKTEEIRIMWLLYDKLEHPRSRRRLVRGVAKRLHVDKETAQTLINPKS